MPAETVLSPSQIRTNDPASGGGSKLGVLDALGLCLLCLALFSLSYVQSRNKMLWGDEIMGVYVLRAGSWHRFLELWRAGIDSSGFWFYAFAKPWELMVGASDLKLRLFSALGVAVSAVLIWISARRFYSVHIVAVAIAVPYLTLGVLRWQLANGRCYGVFLASTALVIFLMVRGNDEAHRKPGVTFLVATFFAYDILAGSHILGVVYAAALLAIQIVLDLRVGFRRYALYATAAVGIALIVVFSLPNIRSTTALGKPVFWTVRPLLRAVYFQDPSTDSPVETAAIVLFFLAFLLLRRRSSRDLVYILLLGMLLLHTSFALISRVSTSIYVDRYLLPLTLGLVLLIAELLTQIRETSIVSNLRYGIVLAALWLVPVLSAPRPRDMVLPFPNYTERMLRDLPKGLPVVDTDVGSFVETEYYHLGRIDRPFLFPIDSEVTNDTTNPGGVSGFHEMDNFQRLGIDAPDLQSTQAILSRYPEFVVITNVVPTTWLARRVQNTAAYDLADLGVVHYGPLGLHYWHVRRR